MDRVGGNPCQSTTGLSTSGAKSRRSIRLKYQGTEESLSSSSSSSSTSVSSSSSSSPSSSDSSISPFSDNFRISDNIESLDFFPFVPSSPIQISNLIGLSLNMHNLGSQSNDLQPSSSPVALLDNSNNQNRIIRSSSPITVDESDDSPISCIDLTTCDDLTACDDEVEIITEKPIVIPFKRRKRESNVLTALSTQPIQSSSSASPPTTSRQPRRLRSATSTSQSVVDLASSPTPSTSSNPNSNRNNSIVEVATVVVERRKSKGKKSEEKRSEEKKPDMKCLEEPKSRAKIIKCPICLEDDFQIYSSGGLLVSTTCGHVYCKNCIHQAIKTHHNCPNCRKKLTVKSYHPIFI